MNIKLGIVVGMLMTNMAHSAEMIVTAYCACKKCCGKTAAGVTASGKKAKEGITVAAPRSMPFGTKLRIQGIGVRVVDDRLAKRYDNRIDLFMTDHNRAKLFGKQILNVIRL
jgi:3D (Asp-Asp-Asp) domain-containing protein